MLDNKYYFYVQFSFFYSFYFILSNAMHIVRLTIMLCTICLLYSCCKDGPSSAPSYLPIDDSEYPYAGFPRIAIELEDFHDLRDRETEIPAHFQVYGQNAPESEVLDLTVRGRGNSSFMMPKYGMKLEFSDKVSMFGMPKNRDWALVANYGDKSHLRNYIAFKLSEWLNAPYTPKCQFVELYLNRKYMGLYLFTETIKVAKNRVNIPENDSSFLFEKEDAKKLDPPFITTQNGYQFHVKAPKQPSDASLKMLTDHLNEFDEYILRGNFYGNDPIENRLDMEDFFRYYWIQEFSKNPDANFRRSVHLTWQKGGKIHMGPIWDFDQAFGNAAEEKLKPAENWFIRNYRPTFYIIRDFKTKTRATEYWKRHKDSFKAIIDSIPLYKASIDKVVRNEYKRWPILQNTENWALRDPYDSYNEAVEAMIEWMTRRYDWIDKNL